MIRRCAKHQPQADSYGTAARNEERADAYTLWGIGDFQSDMARASGVPDVIYPAFALLQLEPAVIPGIEVAQFPEPQEWFSLRVREAPDALHRAAYGSHRTGQYRCALSDTVVRQAYLPLAELVRTCARDLPPDIRPPEHFEIVDIERRPQIGFCATVYTVHWRET